MSKLNVVYGSDDVSDLVPIKQNNGYGVKVNTTHAMAAESLEVDTCDVEIIDDDGSFEFVAQDTLSVSFDNESVGKYYARRLNEANRRDNVLTSYSAIWLLKLKVQPTRTYIEDTEITTVLPMIMDGVAYSIEEDYATSVIRGRINAGTSYDQLFEILFATGGACYTNENGVLVFGYPKTELQSTVGSSRIVLGDTRIEKTNPITFLSVTAYTYHPGSSGTKFKQKNIGSLPSVGAGQNKTIVLNGYYEDIAISISSAYVSTNTTSTTYCSYSVSYDGVSKTIVTVKNETTSVRTFYVFGKQQDIAAEDEYWEEEVISVGIEPTGIDTDNALFVKNHYLVNTTNAREIAQRLWNYYGNEQIIIKGTMICEGEKSGDVISVYNSLTKEMSQAVIKKMEYAFGENEYRAYFEAIIGYVPWKPTPREYTKYRVLQGTGSIKISDLSADAGYDVEKIKIVLVGKGEDVRSRSNAETIIINYDSTQSYPKTVFEAENGKNSANPAPGRGGLINVIEMPDLFQTEEFQFSVGANAVFGQYSSANGIRHGAGYKEEFSGLLLGLPGEVGDPVKGASGGNGGSPNSSAQNGGTVTYNGETCVGANATSPAYVDFTQRTYYTTVTLRIYAFGGDGGYAGSGNSQKTKNLTVSQDEYDRVKISQSYNEAISDVAIVPKAQGYGQGASAPNTIGGAGGAGQIDVIGVTKQNPSQIAFCDIDLTTGFFKNSVSAEGGDGCIVLIY